MRIENRLAHIENEIGIGQNHRPFILIVSARARERTPEDEDRLRRRIEETRRRYPNDEFRLILA